MVSQGLAYWSDTHFKSMVASHGQITSTCRDFDTTINLKINPLNAEASLLRTVFALSLGKEALASGTEAALDALICLHPGNHVTQNFSVEN